MDRDLAVLEDAAATVMSIDRKYRRASPMDMIAMSRDRDRAFRAYAKARINLLKQGVIATNADVNAMKAIRQEVGRARKTQTILAGAVKFARFLVKFA